MSSKRWAQGIRYCLPFFLIVLALQKIELGPGTKKAGAPTGPRPFLFRIISGFRDILQPTSHNHGHDRLVSMETVFCLINHYRARAVDNFIDNFLSPISRETVHVDALLVY